MSIDAINMYNYQITNNNSFIVGVIHSYAEEIIPKELLVENLKLNRIKNTQSYIIRVAVMEV
ncbi:MAG: hypothetical protein ACI31M_04300 [Bacilli bacterium]